jgi:hypothetical protein
MGYRQRAEHHTLNPRDTLVGQMLEFVSFGIRDSISAQGGAETPNASIPGINNLPTTVRNSLKSTVPSPFWSNMLITCARTDTWVGIKAHECFYAYAVGRWARALCHQEAPEQ